MTSVSSRCTDPEVIAAFIAGNLSETELSMTAEHLRTCEDCREVALTAARIDREESLQVIQPRVDAANRRWLALAVAAVVGLVFLTYPLLSSRQQAHKAIRRLVAASPKEARYLEPRLTGGFRWAPLKSFRGESSLDVEQMTLIGAAGAVLRETENDASAEGRHAAAVAHLLAGDASQADEALSTAASNAQMWSDLAAARYAQAVETNDPARLAQALAAADAALRLDSTLEEALFNRALIVERLGLRDQARAAWQRYLNADGKTPWAREARQHLQSLRPVGDFRSELRQRYTSLQADRAAARELARRYPQDARVWGETEILARWADAIMTGNGAEAGSHLGVARAFGEAIAEHGEMLLIRAVQVIERSGDAQRRQLASAHLRFRLAQRTFKAGQPTTAEMLFAQARQDFESSGSPVALLATYFLANTIYEQGRLAESRSIVDRLVSQDTPEFPAHRAQVQWQLGLAEASDGQWGNAIGAFNESVSAFERLGETTYANRVRDLLAELYDRLGERRGAWRYRITALRELGRSDPERLRAALQAAARSAALNREWPVTVSLLGLQLELPAGGDDLLYAEALLDRARIQARLGDRAAAANDVEHASGVIGRISDRSLLARAEADLLAIEAILEGDPTRAVPALSRAIDFHRVRGRQMFIPELLLERGRALAAMGKLTDAAEDFERGIVEMETQHGSVGVVDAGWGSFAIGDELFEEGIDLAIRRGDATTAFRYAERSRAQDERLQSAPITAPKTDRTGVVTVEYVTLRGRLVIFVVERGRIRATERNISRSELTAQIQRLTHAGMEADAERFRKASSVLYETLIRPIADDIDKALTVAFVSDPALSSVPFGALIDQNGKYVIEKHAVVTAPSYAWSVRAGTRQLSASRSGPRLLLMNGPAVARAGSLWSGRREADAVAAQYVSVDVISQTSDRTDFRKRAAAADVIHFVGHAVIPNGSADAALVTSRNNGPAGYLEATDIAAMSFPQTRVVVLAACGTARDRRLPGETSISVARAFVEAGVPAVVATLWPIDDGLAADFFPRLHARLARGQNPRDALRATQLEWIRRPDASPQMWAAIQLVGT